MSNACLPSTCSTSTRKAATAQGTVHQQVERGALKSTRTSPSDCDVVQRMVESRASTHTRLCLGQMSRGRQPAGLGQRQAELTPHTQLAALDPIIPSLTHTSAHPNGIACVVNTQKQHPAPQDTAVPSAHHEATLCLLLQGLRRGSPPTNMPAAAMKCRLVRQTALPLPCCCNTLRPWPCRRAWVQPKSPVGTATASVHFG